jgi:hypothetical protein
MRLKSLNALTGPALVALATVFASQAAVSAQETGAETPAAGTGGVALAEPAPQAPAPGGEAAPAATAQDAGVAGGRVGTGRDSGTPRPDAGASGSAAGSYPGAFGGASSGYGSGMYGDGGMSGYANAGAGNNLANLLGAAMSRNPDIAVAEGKVRAAQSELDRTRLDVSRQVVDAFQSVRFARKSMEIGKAQLDSSKKAQARMQELHKTGNVSETHVSDANSAAREAELALIKAEAHLEMAVATLDYLIGGPRAGAGMMFRGTVGPGSTGFGESGGFPGGGHLSPGLPGLGPDGGATGDTGISDISEPNPFGGGAADPAASGTKHRDPDKASTGGKRHFPLIGIVGERNSTFHERLRKKLAEPTTVEFLEAPVSDVMRYLDDVHGISNIVIDTLTPDGRNPGEEPITLKLEKIPLSAALMAIEDLGNVRFVVTEYGLRLTTKDVDVEDSTPLRLFLRNTPITGTLYFGNPQDAGGGAAGGPTTGHDPFTAGGEDGMDGATTAEEQTPKAAGESGDAKEGATDPLEKPQP